MKLSELSIADLSALLATLSRRMDRFKQRTEENTAQWEILAHKKSCCFWELERRIDKIEWPDKA